MTAKNIQKRLEEVLLGNDEMRIELYEFELKEQFDELLASVRDDGEDYIFMVTVNNGDVAMILVESSGELYINEDAREHLRALWPAAYESNFRKFIPLFAGELSRGEMPVTGFTIVPHR